MQKASLSLSHRHVADLEVAEDELLNILGEVGETINSPTELNKFLLTVVIQIVSFFHPLLEVERATPVEIQR